MSISHVIGLIAGVAVGILLVAVLLKWVRTDKGQKAQMDERQELIRGRGFKYGFFSFLILTGLYTLIGTIVDLSFIVFIGNTLILCVIILISAGIYICYCIKNDAYLAINENPKRVSIMLLFVAAINLAFFIFNVVFQHGIIEDGTLSMGFLNLLCALFLIVLDIVFSVHQKHTAAEED